MPPVGFLFLIIIIPLISYLIHLPSTLYDITLAIRSIIKERQSKVYSVRSIKARWGIGSRAPRILSLGYCPNGPHNLSRLFEEEKNFICMM
jgi:hypothetical protein